MYGLTSDLSLSWDWLVQWTSPMNLLGAAFLVFFLVVHLVALNLVVRAPQLSGGAQAGRKGASRKDEGCDRAESGHSIRYGSVTVGKAAAGRARLARAGHGARP